MLSCSLAMFAVLTVSMATRGKTPTLNGNNETDPIPNLHATRRLLSTRNAHSSASRLRRLSAVSPPPKKITTVRVFAVSDKGRCDSFSDETSLNANTASLIESVSTIYKTTAWAPGPIEIKLVKSQNFCQSSPFNHDSDIFVYSQRFEAWLDSVLKQPRLPGLSVNNSHLEYDHAILLSGFSFSNFNGAIGGVAATQTMCGDPHRATSVIAVPALYVIAHELGHAFGLNHHCSNDIMTGGTVFSQCSIDRVNHNFNRGIYQCLESRPVSTPARSCTKYPLIQVKAGVQLYRSIFLPASCEQSCLDDAGCGCYVNMGPGEQCNMYANAADCQVNSGSAIGGLCA